MVTPGSRDSLSISTGLPNDEQRGHLSVRHYSVGEEGRRRRRLSLRILSDLPVLSYLFGDVTTSTDP